MATTTTAAETALYDDDDDDDRNHYCRARLYISCLITVALSSVILWGLVTISDPKAELLNLKLRNGVNANYSVIDIELQLTNRNYFRGFNYTDSGWIDIFYISKVERILMNNNTYTQPEYQGFGKSLNWNFSIPILPIMAKKLMKTQESHVYVSLVLGYWDKILFWSSDTFDRQWLDAHVYLNNDSFDLEKGVLFNRTQDFTMALAFI